MPYKNKTDRLAQSRRAYKNMKPEAKAKLRENSKRWRINNPEKSYLIYRKQLLKSEYGITPEKYNQMVITQNNRCAICKNEMGLGNDCSVDHNHQTGKIRELLCNRCNRAMGMFQENIMVLESAIAYLKKHSVGLYCPPCGE